MPVAPKQIRIAELDYDQIILNLVEFMKTDPAFADYDFAGSGLRLLTRVLAYVTFYQGYYLSSAVNEAFLDTAQLRASVASHARMLGYEIKGTQSARLTANVLIELANSAPASVTLPSWTQFSLAADPAFSFYTLDDVELTQDPANTVNYICNEVELVEGTPGKYQFTVDINDPTQRFIIPNANIDYSTIAVSVQVSAGSNTITPFMRASNMLVIDANSAVFFVQESYNGYPEIKFGNGVVGKPVEHDNIVRVQYLASRGNAGNNLRGPFRLNELDAIPTMVRGITYADGNTVPSMGGSDFESLDSARFLAPMMYQTQNRCVTVDDYKSVILANYGEHIAAINVFGGEQGDPNDPKNRPIFGRVFVALKPKIGLRFTDLTRQIIEDNILAPRAVVGVIPQVIDPDYTYLNVMTSIKYDPAATVRTNPQLEQAVVNNVLTFAQNNIEKFDTSFRFSKFVRVIDDTDDAILSSLTRIDLEKRVYPQMNVSNRTILKFNSPLRRKSATDSVILEATSHRFSYTSDGGVSQENCFLVEQNGLISVAYRNTSNVVTVLQQNVGTVNINTGLVTLDNFIPTAIEANDIDVRVRVIPAINDFVPKLNQLFTIDPASVQVQLLNDNDDNIAAQTEFFDGGILP